MGCKIPLNGYNSKCKVKLKVETKEQNNAKDNRHDNRSIHKSIRNRKVEQPKRSGTESGDNDSSERYAQSTR